MRPEKLQEWRPGRTTPTPACAPGKTICIRRADIGTTEPRRSRVSRARHRSAGSGRRCQLALGGVSATELRGRRGNIDRAGHAEHAVAVERQVHEQLRCAGRADAGERPGSLIDLVQGILGGWAGGALEGHRIEVAASDGVQGAVGAEGHGHDGEPRDRHTEQVRAPGLFVDGRQLLGSEKGPHMLYSLPRGDSASEPQSPPWVGPTSRVVTVALRTVMAKTTALSPGRGTGPSSLTQTRAPRPQRGRRPERGTIHQGTAQ